MYGFLNRSTLPTYEEVFRKVDQYDFCTHIPRRSGEHFVDEDPSSCQAPRRTAQFGTNLACMRPMIPLGWVIHQGLSFTILG